MRYVSTAALVCALICSHEAQAQDGSPPADKSATGEIIVTAQRRETNLSKTPVAVNVINPTELRERAITTETDFQTALPGLTVRAGQTANTIIFSVRGQTVDANSSSQPSVLPYVNEVQFGGGSSKGGASGNAFFDLDSIQLLKGPQGTLFGRNSTGGAVLFQTAKPTNDFSGFATLSGGSYNTDRFQGAVNIPIVSDKVLTRIATNIDTTDGYQINELNGERLGNTRREDVRLSITLKPSSSFKNDFMVQYDRLNGTNVSAVAIDAYKPGEDVSFVGGSRLFSPLLDTVFGPGAWDAYLAAHPGYNPGGLYAESQLQKADPYRIRTDSPNFIHQNNVFMTDKATYNISNHTAINGIFGFSRSFYDSAAEYDGSEFDLDNGTQVVGTLKQYSAELQVAGDTLGNQFKYVSGVFYSHSNENTIGQTAVAGLEPLADAANPRGQGITTDTTVAGYAQGTLDLSEILGARGLAVTAGGRYTREHVGLLHDGTDVWVVNPVPAGVTFTNPLKDTYKSFSWSLGAQYQASRQLFFFLNSRRSFRSGGFNFYAPPIAEFGDQGGGGAEFRPEQATDIELGTKFNGQIGGMSVRANFTLYQMWIKNIQRSDFVSVFGQLAGITVNVPEAQVRGAEFDGEIKLTPWLSLGGAANYTDARFTKSLVAVPANPPINFGPYPDTPKWSGSIYSEITFPISRDYQFSIRGDVYAQTKTYYTSTEATINPGAINSGYHTVDLNVTIKNKASGWYVAGHVKNLTNETYYIGGVAYKSLFGVNAALPAAPRTFLVDFGCKF